MTTTGHKQTFSEALEEYLVARELSAWSNQLVIRTDANLRMQAAARRMDELTAPKEPGNG